MAKYIVKHTSILHNGRVYKEGSNIELTNNQAKRLEDFVELIPNQKPKTETQNKTQTSKSTAKPKTQNKTETSGTSKDETDGDKDGEQDGGVNNDK